MSWEDVYMYAHRLVVGCDLITYNSITFSTSVSELRTTATHGTHTNHKPLFFHAFSHRTIFTMLDNHGILSAVEIAFFAPVLLIAIFICVRHGFNRRLGWFYILTLSLLRLIGASCLLYAEVNNDNNKSLISAYYVCSSIGTAPLLLALMGFLTRINDGMDHKGLSQKVWRPIAIISLAALVLAIVGGTEQGSSKPSDITLGHKLNESAACLFMAIWAALTGITAITFMRISHVRSIERKLLYACLASIPFLLVRVIYAVAVSFSHDKSSPLYQYNVNVYVSAFMQFAMEAIVVVFYVTAGLLTPETPKVVAAKEGQTLEMESRV